MFLASIIKVLKKGSHSRRGVTNVAASILLMSGAHCKELIRLLYNSLYGCKVISLTS